MKSVVFWGATGHAKVLRECISGRGYELIALFDNDATVSPPFTDVPLHYGTEGFLRWKAAYESGELGSLVAIGGARGRDRVAIQRFLEAHGCEPIVAIHPTAFVAANVVVSKGCQILAHATLCTEVAMGEGCIINTAASVDHECRLGDGVHVAPGAILTGCVTVGDHAMIGAGAVILPRIRIGSDVVVGAGAVVTRDVPDGKVVYGNPARVRRDTSSGA